MNYSKKDNLYFQTEEELLWLKKNRIKSIQSFSKRQIDVNSWKKNLINYFNRPTHKARIVELGGSIYESGENLKINLNVNSFLNMNLSNIELWRKDILFEIDKYLKENFLIRNRVISVQFIGSLGSFNPIKYSDFDCVIILPNKKYLNQNILFQIKKIVSMLRFFSYSFDPNQHHDLFILTEDELMNGIKPFYPLALFKKQWGYGRDYFITKADNITPLGQINFLNNNQLFRRLAHDDTKTVSFYNYKYILSCAFMMPVYFLNFNNVFYGKSKSIKIMIQKNISLKDDFKFISELRLKWPSIEKKNIRNLCLSLGFKLFSHNQTLNFNRRLEFYFPRKNFVNFVKHNKIESVINKSKKISNYLLKKLYEQKA